MQKKKIKNLKKIYFFITKKKKTKIFENQWIKIILQKLEKA